MEVPQGLQPGFAEHGSRGSKGCVSLTLPYFLLCDGKISSAEYREIDAFLRPYAELKSAFCEIRRLAPNLVEVIRIEFVAPQNDKLNAGLELIHDHEDTLIIEESGETWRIRDKPSWFR
jgi:hypothetical protein